MYVIGHSTCCQAELFGVDNAIYLIGGHNQKKKKFNGWWRDKKGDIELFRKKEEFIKYPLENYIVWEKVEVDN